MGHHDDSGLLALASELAGATLLEARVADSRQFVDEGRGFDVAAAFERCNDPELMLSSGRGLLLMRGFSDELIFSGKGNEVTLVLYSENSQRELPICAVPGTGELQHVSLHT